MSFGFDVAWSIGAKAAYVLGQLGVPTCIPLLRRVLLDETWLHRVLAKIRDVATMALC